MLRQHYYSKMMMQLLKYEDQLPMKKQIASLDVLQQ